jgi:hypothetical protein
MKRWIQKKIGKQKRGRSDNVPKKKGKHKKGKNVHKTIGKHKDREKKIKRKNIVLKILENIKREKRCL